MQRYQLNFSKDAVKDVDNCFDYLAHHIEGYGNPLVAEKFLSDFEKTVETITFFPKGFPLCEDESLRKTGIRKAHFLGHYDYKIFFHLINDTIIIDMICHDLKNYKTTLIKRKG